MSRTEDTSEDNAHFSFKVVVVGDTGTGKTTLISRQTNVDGEEFQPAKKSTIGISFKVRSYNINNRVYRIQYWDAPGAERYMKLTSRFCAGAAGAVLVFDVNNRVTFEHVEDWLAELERNSTVAKVLVGNKADLPPEGREVSSSQAQALANKHDMYYFEASAFNNTNVHESFSMLFTSIIDSIPEPPEPSLLLRKGIRICKRLANDKQYKQQLFSTPRVSSTETVDWL